MNAKVVTADATTDITDAAERRFLPGKLILVSQAAACVARLNELCPSDQERTFTARWTAGNELTFEEFTPEPLPGPLDPIPVPPLHGPNGDTPPTPEQLAALAAEHAAKAKARADHVAALKKKLHSRSNADLQEMAARLSVAWVEADTRDTRLGKIAEAAVAAEEAAAEVESGT